MKGIILEGVSAIGKSTILKGLQEKINDAHPNSTKFYISEHYTQRMLEHILERDELEAEHVRQHLNLIIKNLSLYQRMLDDSKFAERPSGAQAYVTIERFLFTYLMMDDDAMKTRYSKRVANRQFKAMQDLHLNQYLLVASRSKIRANIEDTLSRRNDAWAAYVETKGGVDAIADTSFNWQGKMVALAEKYQKYLPTIIIQVDDKSYEEIIDEIFEKEFNESK